MESQRDITSRLLSIRSRKPSQTLIPQAEESKVDKKFETSDSKEIIPFPKKFPIGKGTPVPNLIVRSSLFGVIKRGARKQYAIKTIDDEWPTVASWGQSKIQYIGFQLDQADLDTWLACIELAKPHGFGAEVTTTTYALLKMMKKKPNAQTYEWLRSSLKRLRYGTVKIKQGETFYEGSMILELMSVSDTKQYKFRLNFKLASLFKEGYTAIPLQVRQSLNGDLSKWLFSYLCTHQITRAKPHCISLEKLKFLCGSESEMKKFKQTLKLSIEKINKTETFKIDINNGNSGGLLVANKGKRPIDISGTNY